MAKGQIKDETGNVYGELTVTGRSPKTNTAKAAHWYCLCSCGIVTEVAGCNLRNGQSKSCGCKAGNLKPYSPESLYKKCFRALEFGAKDRGFETTLDFESFKVMIKGVCWYCGSEPYDIRKSYKRGSKIVGYSEALQGVDRLDSSIGYVDGNCVPCCSMCNRMKSDFTLPEFMAKVDAINNYRGVQI